MSCRPPPSEDRRRDLIDAWLCAFELRTVRRRSGPSSSTEGGIEDDDRDRRRHAQAIAHASPRSRRPAGGCSPSGQCQRSGAALRPCSPGRAATAANACGRSRTAGTSPARSSASCSPTARRSFASRPSSPFASAAPLASAASPTPSTPSRSPARRCAKASTRCPVARLAGPELDVRLLVDHRERLVAQRTALSNDLRWHLHDLWPETVIPPRALTATGWQTRIAARLARAEQTARVRIARDELRRVRELTRTINDLHAELGTLVAALAPRLLAERGCGVLTAAKLARRDRRRHPLHQRRQARPQRRHRAYPRLLRTNPAPPPRPRRQPPDQLRAAPPRHHQGPPGPRERRLPRPPPSRRQDPPRSHPLPQAPPRPPRLAPPPTRPRDHHPHQHSNPPHAHHHDPLQPPDRHPSVDIEATSVDETRTRAGPGVHARSSCGQRMRKENVPAGLRAPWKRMVPR